VFQGIGFTGLFPHYMTQKFTNHVRSLSKSVQTLRKMVATELAILFQRKAGKETSDQMRQQSPIAMNLHGSTGARKYLNVVERQRFRRAMCKMSPQVRAFCLTLMWSGGRISETLALTPAAIDLDGGVVTLHTLKRRQPGVIREVPLPGALLRDLDRVFGLRARQRDPKLIPVRLWPWSRTTAWRRTKEAMAVANLLGPAAMPKGLRHTFGVAAFAAVPPHIVQRWMGHASLRTTAIYGDVSGREERGLASRVWRRW
jgi:integrase